MFLAHKQHSTNTVFIGVAGIPSNELKKLDFKLRFNWMAINSINYLNPIKAYKLNGVDKFCHCVNLDLLELNDSWFMKEPPHTRRETKNKRNN